MRIFLVSDISWVREVLPQAGQRGKVLRRGRADHGRGPGGQAARPGRRPGRGVPGPRQRGGLHLRDGAGDRRIRARGAGTALFLRAVDIFPITGALVQHESSWYGDGWLRQRLGGDGALPPPPLPLTPPLAADGARFR